LDESESQWQSLVRIARLIDPDLSPAVDVLPFPVAADIGAVVTRRWSDIVRNAGGPAVALHLGSGIHVYKRWPVSRFVQLAERIKAIAPRAVFLLTGQAAERELIAEFTRTYTGCACDLSSITSVAETAAILQRCHLLISNDGGVMHLGAAMGVPTVGLFGPASPQQWAPRGPRATFLQGQELPCQPCIRSYREAPPARCTNWISSQCMLSISVDDVIAAARRVAGSWLA
jgi:heptosyltransferase II